MFKEHEKKDRERKRKHRDNLSWEKKSKSMGLSDIFSAHKAAYLLHNTLDPEPKLNLFLEKSLKR